MVNIQWVIGKQEIDKRRHLEGNYRRREMGTQQEMEGEMVLTCCLASARGIDVQHSALRSQLARCAISSTANREKPTQDKMH